MADPRHASFFWVPYWHAQGAPQVMLNIFHFIRSQYPFFNASVAANFSNHIIVQPQDLGFDHMAWGTRNIPKHVLRSYSLQPGALLLLA